MKTSPKIMLFGLGKVGREVLQQLYKIGLDIQIFGIADSSAYLMGEPLTNQQVNEAIEIKSAGNSLAGLRASSELAKLLNAFSQDLIIVDTSAATDLNWMPALNKGCKLVFANKNAHSAPWVQSAYLFNHPDIRYEATVGAGLPVITTLRGLVTSGDKISRIEGVMSGTLGYICSQLEAGVIYSKAVQQAYDAGYTEPDPRDDLSGFDVLRKSLILGRTAGWQLEQKDIKVDPLYDEHLLGNSVDEFLLKTFMLDRSYSRQVEAAVAQGNVLRYVATVTPNGGEIGLKPVRRSSTLGALQGPGNYFAIYSQHYNQIPLVIAGPGAGIEVTANGVLNDIIALINP